VWLRASTASTLDDGAKITFDRPSAPEDTMLIRDWDGLDPILVEIYEMNPSYDELLVVAYYDPDHAPNSQNTFIESNLPAGVTPPPGAITHLEFLEAGDGLVVRRDVDAASGELQVKWILVSSVGITESRGSARPVTRLHHNQPDPFNPCGLGWAPARW
jgi:hypothetical protein